MQFSQVFQLLPFFFKILFSVIHIYFRDLWPKLNQMNYNNSTNSDRPFNIFTHLCKLYMIYILLSS